MSIALKIGDITQQADEAIVNAANTNLLAGGGVCGAIHKAAGPRLEAICKTLAPCPIGSAVITPGFELTAKYVIHAVGPKWFDGTHGEAALLMDCYWSIFELVREYKIKSISIPAISTGIHQFPAEQATRIAMKVLIETLPAMQDTDITFICFDQSTFEVYKRITNL
jgi:O-acetyl-ADP-ribose deacetylase (regulator of RNase III)